jgi:hypothetical protein
MTDAPISAVAAITAAAAQAPQAAPQPTPQQIARFEAQLQEHAPSRYGPPLSGSAPNENLRPMIDYAGRVSQEYRTKLERPGLRIDAEQWPELYVLQEVNRDMRSFSLVQLQLEFIGKGVEATNRGTQVLYQQA